VSSHQVHQQIPFYAADGTPMGYRSPESARRLLDLDLVSPAYGRKGHLKAIFAKCRDGSSSVEQTVRGGTRYSYRERLETGARAWRLKRLGKGAELRPIFLAIVTDCMASR
jgi:hypothetical protein